MLGFASGLPLALTSGTLQAWATVENVPLQQIGFLTLVGTAYTSNSFGRRWWTAMRRRCWAAGAAGCC